MSVSQDWLSASAGAVIGALGALGVAVINGRGSMNETIDSRIKMILADDEKTIKRLEGEVYRLKRYVTILTSTMLKAGIEVPPESVTEFDQSDEEGPTNG